MEGIWMTVELGYVIFSLLLAAYTSWRYLKRRERGLLYLTISSVFLPLSALFQTFSSTWRIHALQLGISIRLLELIGLSLFACFIISAIIAVRKMSENLKTC
jgi:ABC-type bacteriocin/lantibiotic exporter with double-glycine peptidase domain